MTRIENAMVEDGHWRDTEDAARWDEKMARLDDSIDALADMAREEQVHSDEIVGLVKTYVDRVTAANDALTKVLKAYRGQ